MIPCPLSTLTLWPPRGTPATALASCPPSSGCRGAAGGRPTA